MIQPISANINEVRFRATKKRKPGISNSHIALANAGGIAAAAGGLTTLITRAYTNSFAQAGVLGVFSAFLAMFFMTPHLIDKISTEKALKTPNIIAKEGTKQASCNIKKPFRKIIQFRAEKV